MAIKIKEAPKKEYKEFVHRCGEIVNAIVRGSTIVGYADISKVTITVCPHCLKAIELDDLQIPSNVEQFGWPN